MKMEILFANIIKYRKKLPKMLVGIDVEQEEPKPESPRKRSQSISADNNIEWLVKFEVPEGRRRTKVSCKRIGVISRQDIVAGIIAYDLNHSYRNYYNSSNKKMSSKYDGLLAIEGKTGITELESLAVDKMTLKGSTWEKQVQRGKSFSVNFVAC